MRIDTDQINAGNAATPQVTTENSSAVVDENATAVDGSKPDLDPAVVVRLSPEAMEILREGASIANEERQATGRDDRQTDDTVIYDDPSAIFGNDEEGSEVEEDAKPSDPVSLSASDRSRLAQLRMQDAAVRSQQFSRMALAGSLAEAMSTQFTSGPDGRLYATAGDVDLDTDPGQTPQESLSRANTLRRVSSSTPSVVVSQTSREDVSVQAMQIELSARSEINKEVLDNIVQGVQFDAEVTRRDSGAAHEAANWTAPPELQMPVNWEVDDYTAVHLSTELEGAKAVTEIDEGSQSRDESHLRESNLKHLFGDPLQTGNVEPRLETVA